MSGVDGLFSIRHMRMVTGGQVGQWQRGCRYSITSLVPDFVEKLASMP